MQPRRGRPQPLAPGQILGGHAFRQHRLSRELVTVLQVRQLRRLTV